MCNNNHSPCHPAGCFSACSETVQSTVVEVGLQHLAHRWSMYFRKKTKAMSNVSKYSSSTVSCLGPGEISAFLMMSLALFFLCFLHLFLFFYIFMEMIVHNKTDCCGDEKKDQKCVFSLGFKNVFLTITPPHK